MATSGAYGDLSGRPTIPAPQVQSDWNASSGIAAIANRPSTFPPSAHTHTKDQVGLGNVADKTEGQMAASGPIATAIGERLLKTGQAAVSAYERLQQNSPEKLQRATWSVMSSIGYGFAPSTPDDVLRSVVESVRAF